MKICFLKAFAFLLILVLLLSLVSCDSVLDMIILWGTTQYGFSPELCQSIFGCTPEEFFDLELDIYAEAGDFRYKAKIESNGYLVIYLNPMQKRAFADSSLLTDYGDNPRIEVSYEDKYVIVNGFEETVGDDITESLVIARKIYVRLIINGEISGDVNDDSSPQLKYILRDGVTKEVYLSCVYPNIRINTGDYEFSCLPK